MEPDFLLPSWLRDFAGGSQMTFLKYYNKSEIFEEFFQWHPSCLYSPAAAAFLDVWCILMNRM
jgi:hypothetical protein